MIVKKGVNIMDKELIKEYIDIDMFKEGTCFKEEELPGTIGNAIYQFGDTTIKSVLYFWDASKIQDGSMGMIITPEGVYFQLDTKGMFTFDSIESLSIKKHRHDIQAIGTIKANTETFTFQEASLDVSKWIEYLADLTDISINRILTNAEKIDYYTTVVLHDLLDDAYEDMELTPELTKQINEYLEELDLIHQLEDKDYEQDLDSLNERTLPFFQDLELDSEEIDILEAIQAEKQKREDQIFEQTKNYFNDMMNEYQQGNTAKYDQAMRMAKTMGIDEESLKNMSPQEMEEYLDQLCDRLGISKSQIERLAKRLQK